MNQMTTAIFRTTIFRTTLVWILFAGSSVADAARPNVLFICVDDLNHWVGYTGRNPQAQTPNIDRLSAMGVSFSNAHCAAPACEPSRAALFSGRRPTTSGCYLNGDKWKKHVPEGSTLNATFKRSGYFVAAMGKTYHSSAGGLSTVYASEWDEYPKVPPYPGRAPMKLEDTTSRSPSISRTRPPRLAYRGLLHRADERGSRQAILHRLRADQTSSAMGCSAQVLPHVPSREHSAPSASIRRPRRHSGRRSQNG